MKKFVEKFSDITDFALACHVLKGTGAKIHKKRPNHGFVLPITEQGSIYLFDNGTKIPVKADSIIYLPKDSDYSILGDGEECYAINFDFDTNENIAPFSVKIKNKRLFCDLFKDAEAVWRTKNSGYQYRCRAIFYQILYALRKEYEKSYVSSSSKDLIVAGVEYIHSNYAEEIISLPHLATLSGISETYFRRLFHKVYGISPLKYINSLRIARAKELINSGMHTISEVARLSGFNDEAYFSREFKKNTGVSPSEYKEK